MTTPSDQPVTGEALLRLALTLPPGRVRWCIICAASRLEFSSDTSVPVDPAPIKAACDALAARFLNDESIPASAVTHLRDAATWAMSRHQPAEARETD